MKSLYLSCLLTFCCLCLHAQEYTIKGLVKTYHPPFTPWNQARPDAHEALGLDNFCMAEYDAECVIRLK